MIRKGAEITLTVLPNMLLQVPSAAERSMSTMHLRFSKIFRGDFTSLVQDIHLPSVSVRTYEKEGMCIPRSHAFSQEMVEQKNTDRASNLPNKVEYPAQCAP